MPATNMYACHSSASLCFSLPLCVTSYMRLHAMCPLTTSRTIARTRTRTRTRIRTHAHMQCKVCVWSCITLSLAVVCWEMLMDSDSMPTCALWRRSKLIHVAQPTTEIHSLHAQFCHSLRKYQVCLGWGGEGGGGGGALEACIAICVRSHAHTCMAACWAHHQKSSVGTDRPARTASPTIRACSGIKGMICPATPRHSVLDRSHIAFSVNSFLEIEPSPAAYSAISYSHVLVC